MQCILRRIMASRPPRSCKQSPTYPFDCHLASMCSRQSWVGSNRDWHCQQAAWRILQKDHGPTRNDAAVNVWHLQSDYMTTYLNSVLNCIGEVLERTNRNRLFRRILRGRVGFGNKRNDNLCVTLGAKSARFQEGLVIVDTSSIHVFTYKYQISFNKKNQCFNPILTCFHIVQCIGYTRQSFKELVIVDVYKAIISSQVSTPL